MPRDNGNLRVKILRLPHAADLPLPAYQSDGAAGMDVVAAVTAAEPVTLPPGGRALIPTGFAVALPSGTEMQVRPRSGLAIRHGVTVLNAPGTVDSDYRGEVQVILVNHGDEPFEIRRGDRIAQLVISHVVRVDWIERDNLDNTARGSDGFGSTGTS